VRIRSACAFDLPARTDADEHTRAKQELVRVGRREGSFWIEIPHDGVERADTAARTGLCGPAGRAAAVGCVPALDCAPDAATMLTPEIACAS
jgi:hypothetical protein